jgi:Arc/MetJ family transcription regulator
MFGLQRAVPFLANAVVRSYTSVAMDSVDLIVVITREAARRAAYTTRVYGLCMGRTNVDIDDEACAKVMARYGFRTKREAINFALREVTHELTLDEARNLRGSGWEGDLDAMRAGRVGAS